MLASKNIHDLTTIIVALRDHDNGCVWNKKQTFSSLIPYLLEEAYEVIDAIERENHMDLCNELGDLLLQVVYHATIAEEAGSFTFEDVVYAITAKMIRRHPHVFGTIEQKKRGFVKDEWERIKKIEKAEQKKWCTESSLQTDSEISTLTKIKQIQPADKEAIALQTEAAKAGFDWHRNHKSFAEIENEFYKLKDAVQNNNASDIETKFGDFYFSLLNLARHLNIDSQKALKKANVKFRNRFSYVEKSLSHQSKTLADASLKAIEILWNEVENEK
ncbi:nucleoside triphosphate pyrophosphohydrolase [Bartonella sp. B30(2025)]